MIFSPNRKRMLLLLHAAAFSMMVGGCADQSTAPLVGDKATEAGQPANAVVAATTPLQITNLKVASKRAYAVASALSAGDPRYIDNSSHTVAKPVPAPIQGQLYIRTAVRDREAAPGSSNFLSFDVNQDVVVYVAHDDRLNRPAWLKGFTDTGLDLLDTNTSAKFSLFKKSFAKGTVTLGSNVATTAGSDQNNMYTVIVVPSGGSSTPTDTAVSNPQQQDPPPPPDVSYPGGVVPAFPGAEGFGAVALSTCNRRDIEVRAVTNLNDAGPGSLRDAVAGSNPSKLTYVVFKTGGTITLNGPIEIARGCLYIAGQTAPGGGIQLRGPNDPTHRVPPISFPRDRSGHDVVIRYLRVRAGRGYDGGADDISITSGYNIILDHISTAWGNDESISISPVKLTLRGQGSDHITIQNSFITTTLATHSTGSIIGSGYDEPTISAISLIRNAYIHNTHRNPLIRRVCPIEVVNNVVYNWRGRVGSTNGESCVDFINNYFKKGPQSGADILEHGWTDNMHADPTLYMIGNVVDPVQMDPSANQRDLIHYYGLKTGPLPASAFVSQRQARPQFPVRSILSASAAYTAVLANSGASQRLTCDGSWTDARDALDRLLVSQIERRTGPRGDAENDNQSDYGGFPTLAAGTPCADSDQDGMPDAFEQRYGLNPRDPSDAVKDANGDGFTNLEAYLSGIAAR